MMKKVAVAGLAAIALAGCVTSSGTKYNVKDPFLFFSRAAGGGSFPVMIAGEPYPGRQVAVESVVLSTLDSHFRSFGNPFRVVPTAPSNSSRLILVFNGAGHPLAETVCANPAAAAGSGTGPTLAISAAYCGDGPYSSSWVSLPTPTGPEAPEFREALDQLILEALPRDIDPSQLNDSNDVPPQ